MAKTLLVVDDDSGLCEMLRAGLEIEEYRVLIALNGLQALRLVESEKPDLVILDLAMPGMSGWEVLDRIESDPESAGMPVIIVTALSADRDVIRGLEKGALDYITKPFSLNHLLRVIDAMLTKLDSRGQEQYRQQIIAQRKYLMHSLQSLFPAQDEDSIEA